MEKQPRLKQIEGLKNTRVGGVNLGLSTPLKVAKCRLSFSNFTISQSVYVKQLRIKQFYSIFAAQRRGCNPLPWIRPWLTALTLRD